MAENRTGIFNNSVILTLIKFMFTFFTQIGVDAG